MDDYVKVVELKEGILGENDKDAKKLHEDLNKKKTVLINLMSAPGSGKTTTLLALNKYFKDKIRWGVMEADIDSAVDAKTMLDHGIPSVQLHTGGMCHLDAEMTRQGITEMNGDFDLLVLENIGNLVCPAEYDTGAHLNMNILSVPEGDDKPLKYPLMYEVSDIMVINKIDTLPVFDFDIARATEYAKRRNKDIQVFAVSSKTGEGIEELAKYILKRIKEIRG